MFGGGRNLLIAEKRSKAGKKIAALAALGMVALISLCGCSNGETTSTDDFKSDYEAQTAIKEQIEGTAIPKGYGTLLADDDDYLTVLVQDGEADVTVKTYFNFTIPYTAEVWLPITQQAVEDAGVTLSRFTVNAYGENADGIVDGTFASWTTEDCETGTLVDQIGLELKHDGNTIKQGRSIEQLFEYYSEWDDTVNKMIVEGGGTGYER